MTSHDNPKTAHVGESSCEFRRSIDSLTTAHDGLKSYWDMIFAHVKDELPSLDSDLSSSGSEDDEVAIFQRDTTVLISCLPEDLRDLSLDDPVLEEMLESARCPSEAWATENIERNSDDHEDFWGETIWHLENSTGVEKGMKGEPGPFNGGGPTDSTSSVDFITDKNLLYLEAESKPDEKEHLTDLSNNGGGDPYSSRKQKVISNKEQKSLKCRASGVGNLDYWCIPTTATAGLPELTTAKDFVKTMSENTSQAILDKTASPEMLLINSSKNQENKQVSKEKQRRGELTCAGWQTHNPPVLSLECVEEADLDEILRSLQHVKVHSSHLKNHGPDVEDLVNSSWSGSGPSRVNSEKNLMEQLTLLCTKQSGEAVTLNSQASMSIGEHESNREQWIRNDEGRTNYLKKILSPETGSYSLEMGRILPVKKTSEPKTVFVDLRNWEQERNASQTSCRNGKEKRVNLQNESGCTGKSMLLRQLRKGSVPGNDCRYAPEQAVATDEEIRAVKKKKRKTGIESRMPVSEQEGVCVAQDLSMERDLEVLSPHRDQLISKPAPTVKKCASRVSIPAALPSEAEMAREEYQCINENSQSRRATDLQSRESCRKERQSCQQLHRQLESLKPLRSVTGKQPSAEGTPLLFNAEASYLPNIRTLPEKERSEMLLLTARLSRCGQLVSGRQQAAFSLDSASITPNLYNALVSWLLCLVPTQLSPVDGPNRNNGEVEVRAPFQVVGLQQAWHEDGLALYACVVPKCQSRSRFIYSKSCKNKVKEETRETSMFYQLVVKYLSQTSLRTVIWWSKELNESLQGHMFPPCVCLSTTHLTSMISVNPDSQAVQRLFEVEIGFYWQTFETEEMCCLTAAENGESCVEEPEVTMALVFENLFINPIALHHTLQLILGCGIDICGLRLLYPPLHLLAESAGKLPSAYRPDDTAARSVLALALRGVNAGTLWMDIVGPSDPQLATVTDKHSINALYCKHRDEPLLYSPHQESRIQWELCVWFGGRIPENGIVQVGIQNPDKKSSWKSRSNAPRCTDPRETCRPPATLVATIQADIFLLVSPVVPTRFYGDIISVCSRRGFILQGMRRLRLSANQAESMGIASAQMPVFCRTGCFGPLISNTCALGPPTTELPKPCFLMLTRKENASHQIESLLKGLANKLAEQGLIRDVCSRLPPDAEFEIPSCFHVAAYTDQTLQGLGGPLSTVPQSASLTLDVLHKHRFTPNPELEQVVVLTLTGRNAMKIAGSCLQDLLRPMSNKSYSPSDDSQENGGFELLGLKWLPRLSRSQAKEITPFEVGDRHWQESIDCLVSSPALVCVLRHVDAFNALAEILTATNVRISVMKETLGNLEKVMSPTAELAFRQAAFFFTDKELMSDPEARPLLKYLSPSLRSGVTVEDNEDQTGIMESIFGYMLLGAQPLLTLLVIKPSTWSNHLPKMLCKLDREHFDVVGLKLVTLDTEKALLLTPHNIQQEPALVKSSIDLLISGPSVILCVQRDNAVKKLLDLLGPEDPQQARGLHPFLWRGHWGTDLVHNGFYGSSSYENAIQDVRAFFPEGVCCEESLLMKAEKLAMRQLNEVETAKPGMINVDQRIHSNVKDGFISPEFPHRRQLLRSAVLTHMDPSAPSTKEDLLLPKELRQTMCLLLTTSLIRTHHPPYIEVLDQLGSCGFQVVGARMSILDQFQAQHVAEIIGAGNIPAMCALLTSGPCLMLALDRDNGICCFGSLLNSLNWEKLNLQDCLQHVIYPKTESQVELLLSYLFDTLAPQSINQIVLQDIEAAPEQ